MIRKIICAYQDPPVPSSTLSEAEKIMWQAISIAVDSANDYEERGLIVRSNSRLAAQEAGFSSVRACGVVRVLMSNAIA